MRKIIEHTITLLLWGIWCASAVVLALQLTDGSEAAELIQRKVLALGWAPVFAAGIFLFMLFLVRMIPLRAVRKTSQAFAHEIGWDEEQKNLVASEKIVDVSFVGQGLLCNLSVR